MLNLTEIYRCLAETIEWCRPLVSISDPKTSLRSATLRPSNLHSAANPYVDYNYDWGTDEENRDVVFELAKRRAESLRKTNGYPDAFSHDLKGGRLLIAVPEESDWSGLSEAETDGFIDALDVPAWDTWISYFHEPTTPDADGVRRTQEEYRALYNKAGDTDFVEWRPPAWVSYLLCWIPAEFVDMVEMGNRVNPVQCLFWAADYRQMHYNTELLHRLDASGLLR